MGLRLGAGNRFHRRNRVVNRVLGGEVASMTPAESAERERTCIWSSRDGEPIADHQKLYTECGERYDNGPHTFCPFCGGRVIDAAHKGEG